MVKQKPVAVLRVFDAYLEDGEAQRCHQAHAIRGCEDLPHGDYSLYTAPRWIPGYPPKGVELAWLRVQSQSGDGEGGWDWQVDVVLGVLVTHDDPPHEEWFEAGDYKGESYRDSIYESPGFVTHWMPYEVPDVGDFGIVDAADASGVQPTEGAKHG